VDTSIKADATTEPMPEKAPNQKDTIKPELIPGQSLVRDAEGTVYKATPISVQSKTWAKRLQVPYFCQKDLLALIGTAGTMPMAPYQSPDFEIWAVAVCTTYESCKRWDVLFEMHTEGYWKDPHVFARLQKEKVPIYMHKKEKGISTSLRYPIEIITDSYRQYHTTSITYMLALAYHSYITTGKPKHVALFGIHMEAREEYTEQRPCCEYWLGVMEGAGMDVEVSPGGALLVSSGLYGYENYNPICYEYRKRIQGLQAGLQYSEQKRMEAIIQKAKQEGGISEAEHWLRRYQRGEIK
jgi:hypothetical protein